MDERTCSIDGCDRPIKIKSRALCVMHHTRLLRHGDVGEATARKRVRDEIPEWCAVEGCDKPHHCRGYCSAHYARLVRYGSPTTFHRASPTNNNPRHQEELFFSSVTEGENGCWVRLSGITAEGYSQFNKGDGKKVPAHRWAYEFLVGPIPEGLHLDHLCRNRPCCNPDHLEPVTPSINSIRAWEWRRRKEDA